MIYARYDHANSGTTSFIVVCVLADKLRLV
jgi:hypothetical protein